MEATAFVFPDAAGWDEHEFDLYWHALNYRTAATENAQEMWEELEACVERIRARDAEARDFVDSER